MSSFFSGMWAVGLSLIFLTSTGFSEPPAPATQVMDSAEGKDEVCILTKNKSFQMLPGDQCPIKLNDPLSNLVAKFLRAAILQQEETINPPKYTTMSYIKPTDELGMIDQKGNAHAVTADEVPDFVRTALNAGTVVK